MSEVSPLLWAKDPHSFRVRFLIWNLSEVSASIEPFAGWLSCRWAEQTECEPPELVRQLF